MPTRSHPLPVRALLCASLLLGACASGDTYITDLSGYPDLQVAFGDLKQEQRRFAAANLMPRKLDFPGHGRVTVREVSLDGYPGNTYVRCRWHYLNTTGKPVLRADVSLDVLDPEGRMVASQVSVCIFPSPRPILEGTYYADELRTQTLDVHLQPGWSWRMTCKATYFEDADADVRKAGDAK
jgi:hypothetical protein